MKVFLVQRGSLLVDHSSTYSIDYEFLRVPLGKNLKVAKHEKFQMPTEDLGI